MCLNISSVVEFHRWWVLKSKLFGQESTCLQGKIFKKILRLMTVRQKVPKLYVLSKSIFYVKNQPIFFKKKKSFKNINLGDQFLLKLKTFFSNINFWTTLFSKIMPNFWWTVSHRRIFLKKFPLSMLILGQKSCILGPTIFKIPQPNWHYYILTNYFTYTVN